MSTRILEVLQGGSAEALSEGHGEGRVGRNGLFQVFGSPILDEGDI
jgi:hypothetical protein